MIATQLLVVPKSIPITSPASSDFHRFPNKKDDDDTAGVVLCTAVIADVRLNKVELTAESILIRLFWEK